MFIYVYIDYAIDQVHEELRGCFHFEQKLYKSCILLGFAKSNLFFGTLNLLLVIENPVNRPLRETIIVFQEVLAIIKRRFGGEVKSNSQMMRLSLCFYRK